MGNCIHTPSPPPKYSVGDHMCGTAVNSTTAELAFLEVVGIFLAMSPDVLASSSGYVQHWFTTIRRLSRLVYPGFELEWSSVIGYVMLAKHAGEGKLLPQEQVCLFLRPLAD